MKGASHGECEGHGRAPNTSKPCSTHVLVPRALKLLPRRTEFNRPHRRDLHFLTLAGVSYQRAKQVERSALKHAE
jgi:hypothetical protein